MCPRLIVTPPPSHKPQHYYPVALTTGVSGDFILIHCMIFSDTSSERQPRSSAESENNWRAHLAFFFLLHWTNSSPTWGWLSYQQFHSTSGCSAALLIHRTAGYMHSISVHPTISVCLIYIPFKRGMIQTEWKIYSLACSWWRIEDVKCSVRCQVYFGGTKG